LKFICRRERKCVDKKGHFKIVRTPLETRGLQTALRHRGTKVLAIRGREAYVFSFMRWRSSMAEQLICNQQVAGSSPIASSSEMVGFPSGQREQTVNLSASAFGGSNPPPTTTYAASIVVGGRACPRPKGLQLLCAGIAQLARASAFQAEGCEFESRFPLQSTPFAFS
jgi:hypothetical protein